MLIRHVSGSLNRVGIAIISALLITVVSLALLVWNTEAKTISGGAGCAGPGGLGSLLGLAAPGDTAQIMANGSFSPWFSDGAVLTKNLIIQGGWSWDSSGPPCNDPAAIFHFVWPPQYSVVDGDDGNPVITIYPTVLSATIQYLDL